MAFVQLQDMAVDGEFHASRRTPNVLRQVAMCGSRRSEYCGTGDW
jgi:hypothetical protein